MIKISDFGFDVLVYIGIFLGVLLAFDGIWQLMSRGERRSDARNRRMRLIANGASTEKVLSLLKPNEVRWGLSAVPLLSTLPRDIRQAGMTLRPMMVVGFALAASVTIGLALSSRDGVRLAIQLSRGSQGDLIGVGLQL
ncbi:MAG: hypothetical protein ABI832_17340 [bacterium]